MYQSAEKNINDSVCNITAGIIERKCASVNTQAFRNYVQVQAFRRAAKAQGHHYHQKARADNYPLIVKFFLVFYFVQLNSPLILVFKHFVDFGQGLSYKHLATLMAGSTATYECGIVATLLCLFGRKITVRSAAKLNKEGLLCQ